MQWYKRDDNSQPPVRILQPISSQIPEYNTAKGEQSSFLSFVHLKSQKHLHKLYRLLNVIADFSQLCNHFVVFRGEFSPLDISKTQTSERPKKIKIKNRNMKSVIGLCIILLIYFITQT